MMLDIKKKEYKLYIFQFVHDITRFYDHEVN